MWRKDVGGTQGGTVALCSVNESNVRMDWEERCRDGKCVTRATVNILERHVCAI